MSPSKSSNSKAFYRAFGLVVAGLIIGILVLALLVTTSGPRVRHVVVQSMRGDDIATVTQALSVDFDRPIQSSDFQGAVEIQPEVAYTVSHRNQQLNITFDQNLLSNTDYVLTIKPSIEDDRGKPMESAYTYEFTTAQPSFTYLERNYDPGAIDQVVEQAPLSQTSHVLFGSDRIKFFARNASYLTVVLPRADNTDELRVVDLGTREERAIDIPRDVRVDNLRFSPVDNQFVFITRTTRKAGAGESDLETYKNTLARYDIDSEKVQPIDTLSAKSSVPSVLSSHESVLYSSDGQALLYRALDGEYYLASATQTTASVLLGKYLDSGGFDRTNTKLTFLSGSNAMIYDAPAGAIREIPDDIRIDGRISTPIFLHNSDELFYLKEPLDAKPGETLQAYTADADGETQEQVVDTQPQASFFGEPVVSYDDRYVLIEITSEPQDSDDYVGDPEPKDPRLVLYDRLDGKVIDSGTIRGIEPVWNR
jgi:Bacterial Ig-like domain